jgi:hypothetical protein
MVGFACEEVCSGMIDDGGRYVPRSGPTFASAIRSEHRGDFDVRVLVGTIYLAQGGAMAWVGSDMRLLERMASIVGARGEVIALGGACCKGFQGRHSWLREDQSLLLGR